MASQILIVDDQAGIRLLLEEILKSEGYQTLSAKTGKQAYDLVEEHTLDLIIMDYNLPVIHGKELLKELNKREEAVPVIVITGDAKESIKNEVSYSFVREILCKPFDIHILKDMVSGVLAHSQ